MCVCMLLFSTAFFKGIVLRTAKLLCLSKWWSGNNVVANLDEAIMIIQICARQTWAVAFSDLKW